MYSLTSGLRVPALQRGLSPTELALAKVNAGVGGVLLASGFVSPPPLWSVGAVGAAAVLLNMSPGPRSLARWATVGYRRLTERTAPPGMTGADGATMTWALYPGQGTIQDPARRAGFHAALSRALTFAGNQARVAGIQVHVTYHSTTVDGYRTHTQTISVHVPKSLGKADRIMGTLEGEFEALGVLIPVDVDDVPEVAERGPGWVGLVDGRYASTARITGWPAQTDGTLMPDLLLGTVRGRLNPNPEPFPDRSLSVLYRPLPEGQSRRSAKWTRAISEAFRMDKVAADADSIADDTTHGALVAGDSLIDLDAYLTTWGDSPEEVTAARLQTDIGADRHRLGLDWLAGQQHRAHVMTSPHGAQTRKGAVL
ncbi:hypothetical protein [Streptomyces sp. NBC_01264]|uniref:hypothetical protein n=1 Tax=Streptomyces sp. NBC_01264 TaxID=2903804 RepID=UPI00224E2896|nr:hypothetical protein [Streptomyces sp. NBC_01264]MCX4784573.1 hypothetical protein [Streptomyces sp. NBC_01264]